MSCGLRAKQATATAMLSSLIEQGKREGKISPALEEVVKTFTLSQIKAFLEKAPVVVKPGAGAKEPVEGELQVVTLSADETLVAQRLGLDPKKFAESKAAKGGVIPQA